MKLKQNKRKLESLRMENGKLQSYALPGGYPLYYLTADGANICGACANGENGSDASTVNREVRDYRCWECDCEWVDLNPSTETYCRDVKHCPQCNSTDLDQSLIYETADAQWLIIDADIMYENEDGLCCDHCGKVLESAYDDE